MNYDTHKVIAIAQKERADAMGELIGDAAIFIKNKVKAVIASIKDWQHNQTISDYERYVSGAKNLADVEMRIRNFERNRRAI
jgi:hypothetical protein